MKNKEKNSEKSDDKISEDEENLEMFPDDAELREIVLKRAHILNWTGWGISLLAVVFVILLWATFKAYYLGYVVGILFTGQGIRFYARELNKRAHNPRSALSKRQMKKYKEQQEQIVKQYFQENKIIAQRVIQMNDMASKGKFKDAYNIARSILKDDPPNAVKVFLKSKQKQYSANF